jgi:hypothetical protein
MKRKHKIVLTAETEYAPALTDQSVREIMSGSHEEMEALRENLSKQQASLLDRRGYLAGVIRIIDDKLEIINQTLRAIEAHQ